MSLAPFVAFVLPIAGPFAVAPVDCAQIASLDRYEARHLQWQTDPSLLLQTIEPDGGSRRLVGYHKHIDRLGRAWHS